MYAIGSVGTVLTGFDRGGSVWRCSARSAYIGWQAARAHATTRNLPIVTRLTKGPQTCTHSGFDDEGNFDHEYVHARGRAGPQQGAGRSSTRRNPAGPDAL